MQIFCDHMAFILFNNKCEKVKANLKNRNSISILGFRFKFHK